MRHLSLYIDLVFCLVVLPAMIVIFPIERWVHYFPTYMISAGVWLYLLYFINRAVTVPCMFGGSRKKRWVSAVVIVLSFAITFAFTCADLYIPRPNVMDLGITRIFPKIPPYKQAIWSLFMIVEAFSFAVGLLTETNLQRARRREVEAERDRAEIQLYKAQIKPHFMFNTLNSLYGLFLTHDSKAMESLEKYISMMRYLHVATLRDMVSVREEADYIRQYVGLQSLRLNDKTKVRLDIEVDDETLTLPPMLLVTFVENCFKHGVSSSEEGEIKISMREKDGRLAFATSNRVFPSRKTGEHLGIDNCRKRLALSFPGRHCLKIEDDANNFNVSLSIDLKC